MVLVAHLSSKYCISPSGKANKKKKTQFAFALFNTSYFEILDSLWDNWDSYKFLPSSPLVLVSADTIMYLPNSTINFHYRFWFSIENTSSLLLRSLICVS
jgi:hypothetical protein